MASLEMSEMYDNALLGILQHVGNIQDFLQVYFGFLYRKTDFYRLLSSPNDKMGFPPGVAEKMVLKVMLSSGHLWMYVFFFVSTNFSPMSVQFYTTVCPD